MPAVLHLILNTVILGAITINSSDSTRLKRRENQKKKNKADKSIGTRTVFESVFAKCLVEFSKQFELIIADSLKSSEIFSAIAEN